MRGMKNCTTVNTPSPLRFVGAGRGHRGWFMVVPAGIAGADCLCSVGDAFSGGPGFEKLSTSRNLVVHA
jgi:hypothetical protein